jgi:DNA-directed RNA polymerase specialized sigma24 family protein
MTTIVTPLGCSRSELNFLEGVGGSDGESRSRAAKEKPSGTAAPLLARLSPKRGEVIDRVYFHSKSVTEIAEIVGTAEAGVRWHGGRY